MKPLASSLELLESRIAPAVLINPTTVTYTDGDGDLVTVKTSKGSWDLANDFVFAAIPGGEQLQRIELSGKTEFQNAKVRVTSAAAAGGDGLVNVGFVNGPGIDLGGVLIDGDLGRVIAGDGVAKTSGLGALEVLTLGFAGLATQEPGGTLLSTITGALGKLRVGDAMVQATVKVIGGGFGTIGSVFVGGDLGGGVLAEAGSVQAEGKIGTVKIMGSLIGANGASSGRIESGGSIGKVSIGGNPGGGNVVGSIGNGSGVIAASGDLGSVQLSGDLVGLTGTESGALVSRHGDIKSVEIDGNLVGGVGLTSGAILAEQGNVSKVRIEMNMVGATVTGTASAFNTGYIGGQNIGKVTILGDMVAGANTGTGLLINSGAIRANYALGSVVVGSNILGTATNSAIISARGQLAHGASSDLAIGSVTVAGHLVRAQVLAGYDWIGIPLNPDAQIGKIRVGGDWDASSAMAGATAGGDLLIATGDEAAIVSPANQPGIKSRIGSVAIGGMIFGTAAPGDHFGFVAQQIGSLKIGGVTRVLAGPGVVNILTPAAIDVAAFLVM